MIEWKEQKFQELTTKELYEISRVRSEVFVVEQEIFLKKTKIFGAKVKLGISDLNGKPKKINETCI